MRGENCGETRHELQRLFFPYSIFFENRCQYNWHFRLTKVDPLIPAAERESIANGVTY